MRVKFNVKRYFQALGVSVVIIIAAAAVCLGVWDASDDSDMLIDNTSTVAVEGGKINVLLMTTDIDGLRTDSIMFVSYDTETSEANIMSIPRDTRIYVGNRYQKINAAHAYYKDGKMGGAPATCEAVTRVTGIPINYYVDFTLDAVAHVVNELGPVDFEIPDLYGDGVGMVYDDPIQSLHINLPPGKYGSGSDCDYPGLTGQQAVWLMRYRHGNQGTKGESGYPEGDLGRVQMQQQFIKALIDQKLDASVILKIPSIFKTVSSEMTTNFTVGDVIKYSKYLTNFSSDKMHTYELPGRFDSATIDGQRADVWEVNIEETRTLVQTVFGYDAENITIGNPDNPSDDGSPAKINTASSAESSSEGSSESSYSTSSSSSSSENTSSYDDYDDDYDYNEDYNYDYDEDYTDYDENYDDSGDYDDYGEDYADYDDEDY